MAKDLVQGTALLRYPYLNKGSAFPPNERAEFKLYGLLPPNVQTLEEQVERAYQQYSSQANDLAKNTFMTSMKEQNEVLYYKVQCLDLEVVRCMRQELMNLEIIVDS